MKGHFGPVVLLPQFSFNQQQPKQLVFSKITHGSFYLISDEITQKLNVLDDVPTLENMAEILHDNLLEGNIDEINQK